MAARWAAVVATKVVIAAVSRRSVAAEVVARCRRAAVLRVAAFGGLLLAYWGLYALLKVPQNFVDAKDATLDARVLVFALGVSLVTGWIFGLIPALQLARPELHHIAGHQDLLADVGAEGARDAVSQHNLGSGVAVVELVNAGGAGPRAVRELDAQLN